MAAESAVRAFRQTASFDFEIHQPDETSAVFQDWRGGLHREILKADWRRNGVDDFGNSSTWVGDVRHEGTQARPNVPHRQSAHGAELDEDFQAGGRLCSYANHVS